MEEPKTMTHGDYKEVYNFLRKKGLQKDEISETGIGAWRQARERGFTPSDRWGYIPGEESSGYSYSDYLREIHPVQYYLRLSFRIVLTTLICYLAYRFLF